MAQAKYEKWLERDNLILLEAWARDGLIDEQIAKNIGIKRQTLSTWKKKYSDISDALKRGKEVVDIEVENALYKRAVGYEYEEVKTYVEKVNGVIKKRKEITRKIVPPDTTAQIYWLKNRRPEQWQDKRYTRNKQELLDKKTNAEIEKIFMETEQIRTQTDKLKGIAEEVEDTTELDNMIYGDKDES